MIHFALIGCGRIGEKHAALCNQFGKLIAVCDVAEERATRFGELFHARIYFSIQDLLSRELDLSVIVVCTPNGLHAEHSIQALNAGFHVLCEKPMATVVADCWKMIEAADQAQRELFIVKQNRFNPAVAAVKNLLDEHILGQIYSVQLNCFWNRGQEYYENSWHGDKKLDGGILFTQFSHFIDILYWMLGDMDQVHSFKGKFRKDLEMELEDTGVACFVMQNGVLGTMNFTINSFKKNMEGSLTILAEKGSVKIGGTYLNEISYQEIQNYVIEGLSIGSSANDYGSYQGSMSNHDKVYEHVRNVLGRGMKNQFSGEEGLKSVEIIQKIYQAV